MHGCVRTSRPAFSLIELVIVVAIIGVIGAIALPRVSTVADRTPETAYKADLATLQNAIERYLAEHQGKPLDKDTFVQQLTQYTDIHGAVSASKTGTHVYGPYLRRMPQMYVGSSSGDPSEVSSGGSSDEVPVVDPKSGQDTGFRFNFKTGAIRIRAKADGAQAEPIGP